MKCVKRFAFIVIHFSQNPLRKEKILAFCSLENSRVTELLEPEFESRSIRFQSLLFFLTSAMMPNF